MGCAVSHAVKQDRQSRYNSEDSVSITRKYRYAYVEDTYEVGKKPRDNKVDTDTDQEESQRIGQTVTAIGQVSLANSDEKLLMICQTDSDFVAKLYIKHDPFVFEGSFINDEQGVKKFSQCGEGLYASIDMEDEGRIELHCEEDLSSSVFPVELLTTCSASQTVIYNFFILPGLSLCISPEPTSPHLCTVEARISELESETEKITEHADEIEVEVKHLHVTTLSLTKAIDVSNSNLQKSFRRLTSRENILDVLYNQGGAKPFLHNSFADVHHPTPMLINTKFLTAVKSVQGNSHDNEHSALSECLKHMDEWDFDIFKLDKVTNGGALLYLGLALCYRYDLPNLLNIDEEVMVNFWQGIHAGYHRNAYHNQLHAADVLQITHFIIVNGLGKAMCMKPIDHLAALVAAAAHDYDHPGLNNNFHIRTKSYLATLYNDRSVLENHHSSCVFEGLRHIDHDILSSLTTDSRKTVRDTALDMILSTDMGSHAKIVSNFKRRLRDPVAPLNRRDDLRLCLSMAVKTADISNCSRPLHLYAQWADRIAEEFYIQGDAELNLFVPVSPFMDRGRHATDFPNGQISFINYIVSPLFELMSEFLPELSFANEYCSSNRAYWSKMLQDARAPVAGSV
eukprot:TRINITY_DN5890_c0_g1_i1.p1 TRINITY_DN5890_c0_g1~~TRINITY_DN5890_c0_g1_i1.p1  ORF type:complete len:625 (+),score=58.05 TRINITY_DN5890_c0_g1_i1:100-1974(+)